MATISGTVMRYDDQSRITGAVVKATAGNHQIVQTITDDDGDFTFVELSPGKWTFLVLHEKSLPGGPVTIDVMQDVDDLDFKLQRLAGTQDLAAGRTFFFWLLGLLGVLIVLYVVLHLFLPVAAAGQTAGFQIWSADPFRFLEIMLWGLAGVLVNKIITTGWYLRTSRFYREGILMHVAHLVATPLLVLVAVILLSIATFELTLTTGSQVTLDLSEPALMVVVAFVLGSSPWPLWNMIERTARHVTGRTEEK